MIDFSADSTLVTTIDCGAFLPDRVEAIESFRQGARDSFEVVDGMARKQVAMREPSPLQRTLQQLDALLRRKILESHRP